MSSLSSILSRLLIVLGVLGMTVTVAVGDQLPKEPKWLGSLFCCGSAAFLLWGLQLFGHAIKREALDELRKELSTHQAAKRA